MLITMILVEKDMLEYGISPRCCWANNPRWNSQPFLVTDDTSPRLEKPADTYAYLATICRMAREMYD